MISSSPPLERLRLLLNLVYGPEQAGQVLPRLEAMLQHYQAQHPLTRQQTAELSEKDAILITYADTIQEPGKPPLQSLDHFLQQHLPGVFSSVHLLPFFPYSSDDGFSVIDYRQVDPSLGSWADIARLAEHHSLMFDAVVNHVSSQSAWFQAYLQCVLPYDRYFIAAQEDWDLTKVVRPRTLPLLTPVETSQGCRHVWTTFSSDQVDLNYTEPEVLFEIINVLLFYVAKGAKILRLDAIAYLWKEPGTACIHLPKTHAVVKIFRAVLDIVAPHVLILTETNVPHQDNIQYFGEVIDDRGRTDEAQMVYQFPLAPLVLHTLAAADCNPLRALVASLDGQGPFFNFIASHDGIGVLPASGLLSEAEIQALVTRTEAHGGYVSSKSNPGGKQSPYELNITLYDALNDPRHPDPDTDIPRFLASQAIMLSMAGVPGVYVHSLFGSRNCHDCVAETGRPRSINRQKLNLTDLEQTISHQEHPQARIYSAYRHMLVTRSGISAFHPRGPQKTLDTGSALFSLIRSAPETSDVVVCVTNVSAADQALHLTPSLQGLPPARTWQDTLTNQTYQAGTGGLDIKVRAYQSLWLRPIH